MPEYQLLLSCHTLEVSTTEVFTMDYTCVCLLFLLCDIYIVGNWHAEAVEEFEEEGFIAFLLPPYTLLH